MLNTLMRSFRQAGRVLRNFVTRPFFIIRSKLFYLTNFARYLGKLPSLFTALPKAIAKKPRKREDYASVGRVFMAKKYIVLIIIAVIALPLLFYFFLWPIIQPLWFTASYTVGDSRYDTYSGKVRIYYDDDRSQQMFEGRLQDGRYTDRGTLYYRNSFVEYDGTFTEGEYDGLGDIYREDGMLLYSGGIAMGSYQGSGTLYGDTGAKLYAGEFDKGLYTGSGVIYFPDIDGSVHYDGSFEMGRYHGNGTLYSGPGAILYVGEFSRGLYHGWGELYSERGILIFEGEFERGEKSGFGTQYDDEGNLRYKGGFRGDLYDGIGQLYDNNGFKIYDGGFADGLFSGQGRLQLPDDDLLYEGEFSDGFADGFGKFTQNGIAYTGDFAAGNASGSGTFTDRESGVTFTGLFDDGMISPAALFAMDVTDIYDAFSTGMTNLRTDEGFFLHNSVLGYVSRFEYASESTPARLVQILMHPRAKLPTVGGEPVITDTESAVSAVGQRAFGAAPPADRVLTLLGITLPASAYAESEARGTVLVTTWKTNRDTTALYVFDPRDGDADLLTDNWELGETADIRYYLMFDLGELAPES